MAPCHGAQPTTPTYQDGLVSICLRLPDVLGAHENTGRLHKLLTRLAQGKRVGTAIGEGDESHGRGATLPLGLVFAEEVGRAVVSAVCAHARQVSAKDPAAAGDGGHGGDGGGLNVPFGAATPMHICTSERPTWVVLVDAFAAILRSRGVDAPTVRFSPSKDTGFVSVDCGALEASRAAILLPDWSPGPLQPQLEGCVDWWLSVMHARHEKARAEEVPEIGTVAEAVGEGEEVGVSTTASSEVQKRAKRC